MMYTLGQVISFCSVWLLRMGQLTQRERELVIEMTRVGISARRIALRLRCSKRAIQRVRQRFRQTGSSHRLPGTGRAAKTTAREDRYLGRLAAGHRFNTLGALTAMFNDRRANPVSHWTVRRRLHLQGIRSRVAARKPLISHANTHFASDGLPGRSPGRQMSSGRCSSSQMRANSIFLTTMGV